MSKIYEALLRAEMDRKASGTTTDLAEPEGEPVDAQTRERTILNSEAAESREAAHAFDPQNFRDDHSRVHEQRNLQPVRQPAPEQDASFTVPVIDGYLPERAALASAAPIKSLPLTSFTTLPWNVSMQHLPSLQERGSAVEQFRGLRSRLQEFRGVKPIKAVLVSSGLPEEGKSYIAINLAISLARHKSSRVLLIDGDMRRGSLHTILGTSNTPGLSSYLAGKSSVQEIVQQAAIPENDKPFEAGLRSLSFIPCGPDADKASDLAGNGRFKTLLAELGPLFDWIVVDSSPVNLVSDGVSLARSCDGVLLVTRGGVTKFETAQRALGELKAATVIGVVLNAVDKPPAADGYYDYDNYDPKPGVSA